MTSKTVYIKKYDWILRFYIIDKCSDIEAILYSIPNSQIRYKVKQKIKRCGLNTGLTYSKGRSTIIIIGRTLSVAEFLNTLTHELAHLAVHISEYYSIPLSSEETAYAVGDTIPLIFSAISKHLNNDR